MYIIVSQLVDDVAQSYWLKIVYCDVAISDWIMKHKKYPFISNVARYTGSSPLDVISSVPTNFDTFNRVLDISEFSDKKSQTYKCSQHLFH